MPEMEFNNKNIVSILLAEFPEFEKTVDEDEKKLPYIVFGNFSLFLIQKFEKKGFAGNEIEKVFEFLTRMSESSDVEVTNLVQVGVFEVIDNSIITRHLFEKELHGEALKLFKEAIKW